MELSFKDVFRIMFRHWIVIVLITIFCGVCGYFVANQNKTTQYIATSKIYVLRSLNAQAEDPSLPSASISDLNNTSVMLPTYCLLMQSIDCLDNVVQNVNEEFEGMFESDITKAQLKGMISIDYENSTLIINIKVSTPNPELTIFISSNIFEEGWDGIRENEKFFNSLVYMRQIEYPRSISDILIIESGVLSYALYCAFAGFALAVLGVFIINSLDTHIKSDNEIFEKTGLPVLSLIPTQSSKIKKGGQNNV